jgi:hypothetical protein
MSLVSVSEGCASACSQSRVPPLIRGGGKKSSKGQPLLEHFGSDTRPLNWSKMTLWPQAVFRADPLEQETSQQKVVFDYLVFRM